MGFQRSVIEEANLNNAILLAEIEKIMSNAALYESMKQHAAAFAKPNAAHTIAEEIINTALQHEK